MPRLVRVLCYLFLLFALERICLAETQELTDFPAVETLHRVHQYGGICDMRANYAAQWQNWARAVNERIGQLQTAVDSGKVDTDDLSQQIRQDLAAATARELEAVIARIEANTTAIGSLAEIADRIENEQDQTAALIEPARQALISLDDRLDAQEKHRPREISHVRLDDASNVIVSYSDGTEENAGRLPPMHFQYYDKQDQLIDEEFYPYPGPVRLRYGKLQRN